MSETKFGFDQLNNKTPYWAKLVFGITAVLTTVAMFIVSSDPGIPDDLKVRLLVYLKGLDMLVLGFSSMFGKQEAVSLRTASDEDGPGGTDPNKPRGPK